MTPLQQIADNLSAAGLDHPDGDDAVIKLTNWAGGGASFRALAERAVPFLRDEAEKYEDDGSNEPLELAREIESLLASAPSDESALPSADLAFDGGAEAAHLGSRELFERWARPRWSHISEAFDNVPGRPEPEYNYSGVQAAWAGWTAALQAAALPAVPEWLAVLDREISLTGPDGDMEHEANHACLKYVRTAMLAATPAHDQPEGDR